MCSTDEARLSQLRDGQAEGRSPSSCTEDEIDIETLREQIEVGVPLRITKDYVKPQTRALRAEYGDDLDKNVDFLQVERWCHAPDPDRTTLSLEALESIAERFGEDDAHGRRLKKRLRNQFATTQSPSESKRFKTNSGGQRCRHCVENNVCMAVGCQRTPIESAVKRIKFRCLMGAHLCNAHGTRVNVHNKRRMPLKLKDGRTLKPLYQSAGIIRRGDTKNFERSKYLSTFNGRPPL